MLLPALAKNSIARARRTGSRINIILDLDNTLISSVPYHRIGNTANSYRTLNLKHHVFENSYVIYERPGVQNFLDFLFKHFDVSVWSAATKEYVMFIVDNIVCAKRGRRLKMVLHSAHCDMSRRINPHSPKDLRFIWNNPRIHGFTHHNTFIIDDLPAVHAAQPQHCIAVPEFDVERDVAGASDNVLPRLMAEFTSIK
jgi:TFIIF-interacting CTD phosphatase-like protein